MNIESYYYTDADAQRFTYEALLTNGLILICFVVAIYSDVPWWILALVINVALVRWMLAVHELFHIHKHEQANRLMRLFLLPFSPVNIGYLEYRTLHMGHHKETAVEGDPDAFHIRGGHLRSFVGAFYFPEGSMLACFKDDAARVNWNEVALRFMLFAGLAWWGGSAFWLTWFILRINYAISVWVFFHHLHYRHGEYGTFPLPLPAILKWYFTLVYGKPALYATMHHDIHHQHPRVAAVHLNKLISASPQQPQQPTGGFTDVR